MTLQEILADLPLLTTRERLLLLEALSRSLREELPEALPERQAEREATVDRLFGALRTADQVPTDNALREEYTDYLSKKYS
jgi:hypothetical protein